MINNFAQFQQNPFGHPLFILLMLWELVWKGYALWYAARAGRRNWFIALVVFNTLGILPIVYIYLIHKKEHKKK